MWTPIQTDGGDCAECGARIRRLHGLCDRCQDAILAESAYQDAEAEAAYERSLQANSAEAIADLNDGFRRLVESDDSLRALFSAPVEED